MNALTAFFSLMTLATGGGIDNGVGAAPSFSTPFNENVNIVQSSEVLRGKCTFQNRDGEDRTVVWTLYPSRERVDADWYFPDAEVHWSGRFWTSYVFGESADYAYFFYEGTDESGGSYLRRVVVSASRHRSGREDEFDARCEPVP